MSDLHLHSTARLYLNASIITDLLCKWRLIANENGGCLVSTNPRLLEKCLFGEAIEWVGRNKVTDRCLFVAISISLPGICPCEKYVGNFFESDEQKRLKSELVHLKFVEILENMIALGVIMFLNDCFRGTTSDHLQNGGILKAGLSVKTQGFS